MDTRTRRFTPLDVTPSGEPLDWVTNEMQADFAEGAGHVAFVGTARNFGPQIDRNVVFLRDLRSNTTEYVTQGDDPSLSAEGRYLAFATEIAIDSEDRDNLVDVYRYDRETRQYLLITEPRAGEIERYPEISADGCIVAWPSAQKRGLLVRDLRRSGDAEVKPDLVPAETNFFALSGDGRYVVYASRGSKVVPGDTIQTAEVFVYDRQTGERENVSISSLGEEANHGAGWFVWISPDARYVIFDSQSTNLDPADSRPGFFVRDRQEKKTWRLPKLPQPGDVPEEG